MSAVIARKKFVIGWNVILHAVAGELTMTDVIIGCPVMYRKES